MQDTKPLQIKNADKQVQATWGNPIKCNQIYQIKLSNITSPAQKEIPISKFDTLFNISHNLEPLKVLSISIAAGNALKIKCNENIDPRTASDISLYQLGKTHPYEANAKDRELTLYFYETFANRDYTLHIKSIKPKEEKGFLRSGISGTNITFSNYNPSTNDIILNEVLFEPKPKGSEFIEIYNTSDMHINLENYILCNFEIEGNDTIFKNKKLLPYILMPPKSYLVFTKNKSGVVSQSPLANPQNIIALKSMPSLPNDQGKIALLGKSPDQVLDLLSYHEDMHFLFYSGQDRAGISLERIHFTSTHWKSATKSSGGASPTLKNSNFTTPLKGDKTIMLSKKVFSPNGDGIDDILQINYNFKASGNKASVKILNDRGTLKKVLIQNENSPQHGNWMWEGTDEMGIKLPQGFYIIIIEITYPDGSKKTFRKICVLGY